MRCTLQVCTCSTWQLGPVKQVAMHNWAIGCQGKKRGEKPKMGGVDKYRLTGGWGTKKEAGKGERLWGHSWKERRK